VRPNERGLGDAPRMAMDFGAISGAKGWDSFNLTSPIALLRPIAGERNISPFETGFKIKLMAQDYSAIGHGIVALIAHCGTAV
jgi:hypothetical protein